MTGTRTFRIMVDRTKCASSGQCEFEASEVFHIDDAGMLDFNEAPDVSHRKSVEEAILRCPTGAISLIED